MKVLHVVEAMGGGVETAIAAYVQSVPEFAHLILAAGRESARVGDVPDELVTTLAAGHLKRIRQVRQLVEDFQPDVVHAHSSFAGVYARIGASRGVRVVYSPHCFAFQRKDIRFVERLFYRSIEWLLSSKTDAYGTVSDSESELAMGFRSKRPSFVIPHVVPHPFRPLTEMRVRPRVTGLGRLVPQKGIEFFVECAKRAKQQGVKADWMWIGGGSDDMASQLISAGVEVTGWVDRQTAIGYLEAADIYTHTAAWEGFPLTVVEASSLGLPILAREIAPFRGMVSPLSNTPAELVEKLVALMEGDQLVTQEIRNTHTRLDQWTAPSKQRTALLKLYEAGGHGNGI